MTTPVRPSALVRRAAAPLCAVVAVAASVLLAAPAHADVPEGWSDPDPVDNLQALLLLAGGPVLLFLLICLAVYLPSMVRGERLLPDHSGGEAQWLGGPRSGTRELTGPDVDDSRTGGASGSW